MTGCVDVVKKVQAKSKSLGTKSTTVLAHLKPVVCVGEFSFLTEEPRMASIRATTHCDCLVLRKEDWADFVEKLPAKVFRDGIPVKGTRGFRLGAYGDPDRISPSSSGEGEGPIPGTGSCEGLGRQGRARGCSECPV